MNPTAGGCECEEEGRPSVLGKRSHSECEPECPPQVEVTIYDLAGTSWKILVTIGETLDAAAVATVTGHAVCTFYLSNPTTGQTYHLWLGESYAATATETDPVLIMTVLDSSVAEAIGTIVRLSEELQDEGICGKLRQLKPLICDFQSDFYVAITAVTLLDGMSLELFSSDLRNDPVIVLAAVTNSGDALEHASPDMQDAREVVMAALTNSGDALEHASPRLKNDRVVVVAAVTENAYSLRHASTYMQDDLDVVMAAVTERGDALEHASPDMQDNLDVVMAAVTERGSSLRYASTGMKNNRDVVIAAVTVGSGEWMYASADMQDNLDVVVAAVAYRESSLRSWRLSRKMGRR
jgi:hypothetical protein